MACIEWISGSSVIAAALIVVWNHDVLAVSSQGWMVNSWNRSRETVTCQCQQSARETASELPQFEHPTDAASPGLSGVLYFFTVWVFSPHKNNNLSSDCCGIIFLTQAVLVLWVIALGVVQCHISVFPQLVDLGLSQALTIELFGSWRVHVP